MALSQFSRLFFRRPLSLSALVVNCPVCCPFFPFLTENLDHGFLLFLSPTCLPFNDWSPVLLRTCDPLLQVNEAFRIMSTGHRPLPITAETDLRLSSESHRGIPFPTIQSYPPPFPPPFRIFLFLFFHDNVPADLYWFFAYVGPTFSFPSQDCALFSQMRYTSLLPLFFPTV